MLLFIGWNFDHVVLDICWKLLVAILVIVTFTGYKK